MRKNKIAILLFVIVTIISIIAGYSLIKQYENHKYDKLAVMIKQDDGSYIRSNMSVFGNDDYEFDHAVCNNGSTITANLNGGVNLKLLGSDKCTVYLSLKAKTITERIKKLAQTTKPDFTQVAQETGIYTMEDDYGKSYYFRGAVENNYVKFGDFYWRIVRLNGDGSLRIIYDGTAPHANGEESTDRSLNENGALVNVKFNTNYNSNAYVGYMYGDPNGATYEEVHKSTKESTSSVIKTFLDSWYETNIRDKGLAKYVSDTLFCNDRSVTSGTGVGTTATSYGAYTRANTNSDPILTCPQKNDAFTVDDTENGNGALTYPIGLLTADEYRLAGGKYNTSVSNLYINKPGIPWWLGSPGGSGNEFLVIGDGYLAGNAVTYTRAVVPVINLTAETANQLIGSGTMEDPYQMPIIDRIKVSSKPSTSTMYEAVEPTNEISNVSDDDFNKVEQTYTVDTTHQGYYMTYASEYTFNNPITADTGQDYPTYTLTSPQVGKYSEIYSTLVNKYVVNYEGHNSSTAAKSATIDRIYKVVSATADSITYVPSSYTTNFTNSTTGVYIAEDDYGTSYYFRGNVTNNYVKFGKWTEEVYRGYNADQSGYKEYFKKDDCTADGTYKYDCNKSPVTGKDMYWRIVRINGDGTLRLIYDGTEPYANGTKSLDRFAIQYQKYNETSNNNAYVGYMYGDINGTEYSQVHANTNPSLIKTAIDEWYTKNLEGTIYASRIGDMSFCNDRSLVSGTGIGTIETQYGAYGRLVTKKEPSLICPNDYKANDLFTSSQEKQGGNGKLDKPIGLLTADEVALAGGVMGTDNKNRGYYINKGYPMRLGSPTHRNSTDADVFFVNAYGRLIAYNVANAYGAAPVINLTAEYVNQLKGSGTMNDPYHF